MKRSIYDSLLSQAGPHGTMYGARAAVRNVARPAGSMLAVDPHTGKELAVMAAKFEVYKDKSEQFRFRLKAGNGEVVATGESYPTKAAAHAGCEAVKRAAAEASIADM